MKFCDFGSKVSTQIVTENHVFISLVKILNNKQSEQNPYLYVMGVFFHPHFDRVPLAFPT